GWECDDTQLGCVVIPVYGDGLLRGEEACDDGDPDSVICVEGVVTAGWSCPKAGEACTEVHGDGRVVGTEQCDTALVTDTTVKGPGCDNTTGTKVDGYACSGAGPNSCAPVCGDGKVVGTETCDDGGNTNDDGCDSACNVEPGYACSGTPNTCGPAVGYICSGSTTTGADCDPIPNYADALLRGEEKCANGKNDAYYGCYNGEVQPGWVCQGTGPASCQPIHGDGIILGDETCDDGFLLSATCVDGQPAEGYACEGVFCENGEEPQPEIGDGLLVGEEQCDDKNDVSGDGCSDGYIDAGYACAQGADRSYCADVVGNSVIDVIYDPTPGDRNSGDEVKEECDDGNEYSNDGCTDGQLDEGYACDAQNCTGGEKPDIDIAGGYVADTDDRDGDGNQTEPVPNLSDTLIVGGEECADGNAIAGDGCTDGQLDEGYACEAQNCTGGEKPDIDTAGGYVADTNDRDGDGNQTEPVPNLSDNLIVGDEECADGNADAGDGCTDGVVDDGYACAVDVDATTGALVGAGCAAVGGNGLIDVIYDPTPDQPNSGDEVKEECDDGNGTDGDGCTNGQIDEGFLCGTAGQACGADTAGGYQFDSLDSDGDGRTDDVVPVIGDGLVVGHEYCDDGNAKPGDGCDEDGFIEEGYVCPPKGGGCDVDIAGGFNEYTVDPDGTQNTGDEYVIAIPDYGDGQLVGDEECDDGNELSEDGCSADGYIEPGYDCDVVGAPCENDLEDGIINAAEGEQCDDKNTVSYDGCTNGQIDIGYVCVGGCIAGDADSSDNNYCDTTESACTQINGWTCTGAAACSPTYGDGVVVGTEQCDTGSNDASTGCLDGLVQDGWTCTGVGTGSCKVIYGDGLVKGAEQCDEGTLKDNIGCSATGQIQTGWECPTAGAACAPIYGDGLLVGDEQCDEGTFKDDVGCSATGQVEAGYLCATPGQACVIGNNDGVVQGAEQCDDGNGANNDGCSVNGQIETGWQCTNVATNTPDSSCSPTYGDGQKVGNEQCDTSANNASTGCFNGVVQTGWTCSGVGTGSCTPIYNDNLK
ncbi:MAG: DUF4215 domain-containing protein, partial [Myxococcota bacterium]